MVFMNMETYEEERVPRSLVDKADYIGEESQVTVCRWNGKTIDVQVPKSIITTVRARARHAIASKPSVSRPASGRACADRRDRAGRQGQLGGRARGEAGDNRDWRKDHGADLH